MESTNEPQTGSKVNQVTSDSLERNWRITASYPFLPWNGALPIHQVHRTVRVLSWNGNEALEKTVSQSFASGV